MNLKTAIEVINNKGVTAYQLHKETGFNEAGLRRVLNGEVDKPQRKTQEAIINYAISIQETNAILTDTNTIGIPYYDVDFDGGWDSSEVFSQLKPSFYIQNPDFKSSDFACNLIGDSISRSIPNGAIIGLKLVDNWQTYFPSAEFYGVETHNDMRTVKMVKRKDDKLILLPDPSEEYKYRYDAPETIPIDFVRKFYQVTAWALFKKIAM